MRFFNRHWRDVVGDFMIWSGLLMILLWLLAKTFGYINTPIWIEYLPAYLAVYTFSGGLVKVGRYLQKIDGYEKRFNLIDKRFDGVDKRFDAHDRRFDEIDATLDRIDADVNGLKEIVRENTKRILALEA